MLYATSCKTSFIAASKKHGDHKKQFLACGKFEKVGQFDTMAELVPKYGIPYRDLIMKKIEGEGVSREIRTYKIENMFSTSEYILLTHEEAADLAFIAKILVLETFPLSSLTKRLIQEIDEDSQLITITQPDRPEVFHSEREPVLVCVCRCQLFAYCSSRSRGLRKARICKGRNCRMRNLVHKFCETKTERRRRTSD